MGEEAIRFEGGETRRRAETTIGFIPDRSRPKQKGAGPLSLGTLIRLSWLMYLDSRIAGSFLEGRWCNSGGVLCTAEPSGTPRGGKVLRESPTEDSGL